MQQPRGAGNMIGPQQTAWAGISYAHILVGGVQAAL
jgi:hypothetical protein